MSFVPNYPVVLLPEKIKANLIKKPSRLRSRPQPKRQTTPANSPLASSKTLPIGKFVKALRYLGWGFTGIVGFSLLAHLVQGGSGNELLPGIILLLLKTLIVTGIAEGGQRLEWAARLDSEEREKKRWRDNKKQNQNYHQQCADLLQQQFRQANSHLQLNPSSQREPLYKHTFERGTNKEEAQKGVSEQFFLNFLCQYFSNCQLTTDYFALNDKIGYTTDFSLITADRKLGIDIEIDEPYDGKSKDPHHCTDNNKDRNRNRYLLERGWVVVRLSEYQVVHYPQSCCLLIAELLAKLGYKSYLLAFENVENLPNDPTWTSVTVKPMVARKYREMYLDRAGLFKYDAKAEKHNAKQRRLKKKKAAKTSSKPKYRLKLQKKA